MPITWWIVVLAWAVFIIYWFVSAFTTKRTIKRNWAMMVVRIVVIVAAVWYVDTFHQSIPGPAYMPAGAAHPVLGWIGAVLVVAGIAYAVYARHYLGRNWGMPMSVKDTPELITTGPYASVRHPIYTGVILALLGSALAAGPWWVAIFVVSSLYFIYAAAQEERLMAKTFPDTYPAYKARTKMLIPYIL